jgi:uncharacterized ferritin-like protein (DUF455 family)
MTVETTASPEKPWGVARAADSLNELAYIERATAHVLAGWIPRISDMTVKVVMGQSLYRAIDRATRLGARRDGLTRANATELDVPQGWQRVMRHVDSGSDAFAMLAGLSGVVLPGLIELYRRHLASADSLGDAESVHLVAGLLPDVSSELDGIRAALEGGAVSSKGAPTTPEEPEFVEELEALWASRGKGPLLRSGDALWPPLSRAPAAERPADLERCEPGSLGILAVDSLREPADVGRFLHSDLDEEYTTLELMARNSYEHPDMPWQFHLDMARQASDEARHALMMEALLRARGFKYGDFPISTSSYDGLYQFGPCEPGSRKELLWRMLIRQTFMEGLALDSLAHEIKRRQGAGQDDIVRALDYILRDEVFHVRSGMRWSAHLSGGDRRAILQERYEALTWHMKAGEEMRARFVEKNLEKAMAELEILEEGNRRRGGKPPDRPLNRIGRLQAGLDDDDILQVLSWGYATEAPGSEPA